MYHNIWGTWRRDKLTFFSMHRMDQEWLNYESYCLQIHRNIFTCHRNLNVALIILSPKPHFGSVSACNFIFSCSWTTNTVHHFTSLHRPVQLAAASDPQGFCNPCRLWVWVHVGIGMGHLFGTHHKPVPLRWRSLKHPTINQTPYWSRTWHHTILGHQAFRTPSLDHGLCPASQLPCRICNTTMCCTMSVTKDMQMPETPKRFRDWRIGEWCINVDTKYFSSNLTKEQEWHV